MSETRQRILDDIRAALGRKAGDETGLAQARERIAAHPRQVEPQFHEPLDERFVTRLQNAHATVARVASIAEVGSEVARYLDSFGVAKQVVLGGDERLQQIEWPDAVDVERRCAVSEDLVSVTSVFCGIAETGTLMLLSGERTPTGLNFLPDYHLVVIDRDQLVAHMEDAWDRLRDARESMPRTVNFISGPSKTADVEQTVEYGAHGPRCLHVILVG